MPSKGHKKRRLPSSACITPAILKDWMLQHRISAPELAQALGMTNISVYNWLKSPPDEPLKSVHSHALCWIAMQGSLPGLPTPRIMSEEIGLAIARGFMCFKIKRGERSLGDAHTIAKGEALAIDLIQGDIIRAIKAKKQSEAGAGQSSSESDGYPLRSGTGSSGQVLARHDRRDDPQRVV